MKLCVLNKQNNSDLIVFFGGWGCDGTMFKEIHPANYDVIMYYDYLNSDLPDFDYNFYKRIYLIAWSMGVLMSQTLNLNFEKKTAINGTLMPIHNEYGIPEKIYDLTVNNFNDSTKNKFVKKIGFDYSLNRTNQELKEELIKIKEFQKSKICKTTKFDKAIISANDKIFPYKNQKRFWTIQNTQIKTVDDNHYIKFNSWGEIINV